MKTFVRRFFAILLVLALAMTALVACKPEKPVDPTPVEKEITELNFWTMGGTPTDGEAVWAAINEYLATTDAKLKININFVANADYAATMESKLTAGEKDMDLVYGNSSLDFAKNAAAGSFAALNDALAEYGKNITAKIDSKALDALSLNGTIYGVPTIKEWARVIPFTWNTTILEYLGLQDQFQSAKWVSSVDMADNLRALAKAYNADDAYFTVAGHTLEDYNWTRQQYNPDGSIVADQAMPEGFWAKIVPAAEYDAIKGLKDLAVKGWIPMNDEWAGAGLDTLFCFDNMVKLDAVTCTGIGFNVADFFAGKANGTVFSAFATDEFRTNYKILADLHDEHVIGNGDDWAVHDGDEKYSYLIKAEVLAPLGSTEGQAVIPYRYNIAEPKLFFVWSSNPCQVHFVNNAGVRGSVMHVAFNSTKVNESVEYMDLLASDAKLNNFLTHGIEGVHYNMSYDGLHKTDAWNNYGQWYGVNYGGNLTLKAVNYQDPQDFFTKLFEVANTNMATSLGFAFDPSTVSGEIGAIANVVEKYMGVLGNVKPIPDGATIDTYIDAFNAELEAAGIQKVINEIQAQFDK